MLRLEDREWQEFPIDEVCIIHSGVRLTKADMIPGDTPFIGSSESNNGVTAFTGSNNVSKKKNVLGVNYNGSVVDNFYHPYEALFSDDVKQLEIICDAPTEYMYLFLKAVILKQKSKYAYGYKFNAERMKRQIILLPVDGFGNPDWDFMDAFIRERKERLVSRQLAFLERELKKCEGGGCSKLSDREWQPFKVSDIAVVSSGRDIYEQERVLGDIPYVTSGSKNNGIGYFVSNTNDTLDKNYIALNRNGAVGKAFYHSYRSLMGNDCRKLHLSMRDDNESVGIFVSVAISMQSGCFSYSRKLGTTRTNNLQIMLPIDDEGNPDWQFMEGYVKAHKHRFLSKQIDFLKHRAMTGR